MKSILTSLFSLVLCATLHAQLPSYVPADGLVGWWPFNGNANDESGNGNNGLVNGATLAEDRFGNAGSAYSFDGVPDRVEIGSSLNPTNSIGSPNSSWSVSAWINRNNYTGVLAFSDYNSIAGNTNPGENDITLAVHLQVAEDKAYISMRSANIEFGTQGGFITSDQWHQIAFTAGNGFISLFVDGAEVSSVSYNPNLNFLEDPIYRIGASMWNGNYGPSTGLVDDIAIYNRALTPEEISQLYTGAEEPVATCTPLAPNLQNGLVGYWPFCGNANDESGNGNNGVVNGATLAEDRFGNAGSAFSFDGVDDYVTVEGNSQFEFMLSSSYTVNYWVNLNTIQGTQAFIGQGDGDGQYQNRFWRSYLTQDQFVNHIRGNQSDPLDTRNLGSSIADNSWFMVSMVRDYSITLKLYANGLLVDSDQDITGIANSFNLKRPIYIGAFFNAVSNQPMQYCNGIIQSKYFF